MDMNEILNSNCCEEDPKMPSSMQNIEVLSSTISTGVHSDPYASFDSNQQSSPDKKKARSLSTQGEDSNDTISSGPTTSLGETEFRVRKKKHAANREKKRRSKLNTAYGELMALLMQVDPKLGGGLSSLRGIDLDKSKIPQKISVENLLPRRDLIIQATTLLRMLDKENKQLIQYLNKKGNNEIQRALWDKQKTGNLIDDDDATSNNCARLINNRKGHIGIPQQALIHNVPQMAALVGRSEEQVGGPRSAFYDASAQVSSITPTTNTEYVQSNCNLEQQTNEQSLIMYVKLLQDLGWNRNE